MSASHLEQFKPSFIDEVELHKLVEKHLLPNRAVLQWQPAKNEEIPTPNTNKIIVLIPMKIQSSLL
jgi:hypothetical protein